MPLVILSLLHWFFLISYNFSDAIYWVMFSLTTMEYWDIYPVTEKLKVITMISSFFDIAIVVLSVGIITARYMDKLSNVAKTEELYQMIRIINLPISLFIISLIIYENFI